MAGFRILSLNGGGIRGAFGVSLLSELEAELGRPLSEYFDLIAGTSTGAIIAAGLAAGRPAEEIEQFYQEHGREIFQPRERYRPRGWLRLVFPLVASVFQRRTGQTMDSLFRARYCPEALRHAFSLVFGNQTLADLTKTRVIIPSLNLSEGRTHVFRTPHLPGITNCGELPVVDVLRAATAAPTYFPHKMMPDGCAYCDGGLWAIAPAVLAVAEAMKIRQQCTGPHCEPAFDTSTIQLLSIGTGDFTFSLTPPGSDAGVLYWMTRVADVMGIAQMQGVHMPIEYILGDRYYSIDFQLPDSSWAMDGIEHIPDLIKLGRDAAREHRDRVLSMFCDGPKFEYVPYPTQDAPAQAQSA